MTKTTRGSLQATSIKRMAHNGYFILVIFYSLIALLFVNFLFLFSEPSHPLPLAPVRSEMLVVNLPGCQIPRLDPMHPSVVDMFRAKKPLDCRSGAKPALVVRGSDPRHPSLVINDDVLHHYGVANVTCHYRAINRVNDKESALASDRIPMNANVTNVTDEFVRVDCLSGRDETVYYDYFAFIQHRPEVDERCEKARANNPNAIRDSTEQSPFSVVLVAIDSMSRNQFERHMKTTYAYIKKHLTYVELFGYNKIGVNTFPNMVAMLTGHLENEVEDLSDTYANVLPFVWNDYMKAGYRTLFAEDIPTITIFNYARKGFDAQPTDYYLRTFSLATEKTVIKKSAQGCFKERVESDMIYNWTLDLFDVFPKDPLFSLIFLTRLSHDEFNGLGLNDAPMARFFQRMHREGHLNRTVIYFFGDHGYRFGKIRSTYVGRIEDKLPFAMFLLPSWFRTQYPKLYANLNSNGKRLTTPLDIHATLRYILNFSAETEAAKNESSERGVNLFGAVVSKNRTCESAAIPIPYCSCIRLQPVESTDYVVRKAARKVLEAINKKLRDKQDLCAQFELDLIEEAATQLFQLGEAKEDGGLSDYRITIRVTPGGGSFEGMVWYHADTNTYTTHTGIDRVNLYGNQSWCVDSADLKPFCYCKNLDGS